MAQGAVAGDFATPQTTPDVSEPGRFGRSRRFSTGEFERPTLKRLVDESRPYRMHRLLALADGMGVLFAMLACKAADPVLFFQSATTNSTLLVPFAVLSWIAIAGLAGLYHIDDSRLDCSIADDLFKTIELVGLWIWLVFAVASATNGPGAPSTTAAVSLGVVAVPSILLARALARSFARRRPWYAQTALVVGTDRDRERIEKTLTRHPEYGVTVAGHFHPWAPVEPTGGSDELLERGEAKGLVSAVLEHGVDRVIFASSYERLDERTGALRFLAERGVKVDLVPGDSEVFRSDAQLHQIEGLPLMTLPNHRRGRTADAIKRFLDLFLAGVALLLLAPALLVVAIAVRLDTQGPVFFRQERFGRGYGSFKVVKFRTMVANADQIKGDVAGLNMHDDAMFKIPDDPRITRVGRFLRRFSLDELPQLINVLRGEMSLVGPRPLIECETQHVPTRYAARFAARPGMTGPWQTFGRSDIPFADMLKLDYTYVMTWSIAGDIKLMIRTISALAAGRGAY